MKRVTLYSARHCPHCKTAQRYLEENRIPFRLCDTGTPRGQKELAALGLRAVPVLKIGDQVINGFSPKLVQQALK